MHVDGGHGGGQLVRTALSVSACTGKSLTIENIRAKRPKPGLQPQHLCCVHALSEITEAEAEDAALGATALKFRPTALKGGHFSWDIGTAGSAALLLQCVLPPLLFAEKKSTLTITGGTDVPFAPPSFFMERVFPKALEAFGVRVRTRIVRHGFYPKGGGRLQAEITPKAALKPASFLQRPKCNALNATILSAGLPSHVVEREKKILETQGVQAAIKNVPASSPGNLVFLERDEFNAFSSLGKPGKKAEQVAKDALDECKAFDEGTDALEPHVLDQLLLYAALAEGESRFCVSNVSDHAQTNLGVLSTLLATDVGIQDGVLTIKGAPAHPKIYTI